MRRLPIVLAALLAGAAPQAAPRTHGKSVRGTIEGTPTLVLRGTHRERGRDHGFLCAKEIVRLVDAFVPVAATIKPGGWEKVYVPAARTFAWPKRFEEELAGMLEGIRKALPSKDARTLKSLGREIGLDDLKVMNALSDIFGMGCSSFSAWGELTPDGELLTGRNLDYATFPVPLLPVLIGVEPAEEGLKPTLGASFMGMISCGTVMNSEGTFLALHDSGTLPRDSTKGFVPRMMTLQGAIEAARGDRAAGDIAEALRKAPVLVGNNVHVSAPAPPAAVLEWDSNGKDGGVTVRAPKADEFAAGLVCTNHYRARAGPADCGRYAKLGSALRKLRSEGKKLDLETAKRMLDSVAVNGASVTYLSIVVHPKARRLVLAYAPERGVSATKGRWVTVEWEKFFRAG